ncbi:MAG: excinuclease ABC subunit UvrC [Bdellovibrionales bacterium]|nr:excinuclease ABC subunit UvrC [Bdellovibrionales bacterium]
MTEDLRLQHIKEQVSRFPELPGVYLMRDGNNEVIYIGKAKNLRNRVKTYFSGGDGRASIEFILRRVTEVDSIVTENEHHAFVLERDLITKYKPRYNIRLKDDKAYLNVRINTNAAWPRLELVRQVRDDGALYFGPYTFSYELRTVLDVIKKVVPLRTCTDNVFHNRTRPCLEYQIKRCCGPCCLEVDPDQYKEWLDQAIHILQGNVAPLEMELGRHMERASEELRFEDAAEYRDRIDILQNFKTRQDFVSTKGDARDVFALYREESFVTLSVLTVRYGRVAGSESYSFQNVQVGEEEILEQALWQYYEAGREIPPEIVLPLELKEEQFLREELEYQRGKKVELVVPKRGIKFRLLKLAELNAKQQFLTRFDAEARYSLVAQSLAKLFHLRQVPRRIECVDISNFQGSDIVGALVSFFDGRPLRSGYRRYRISQQGKPDDFSSVKEVVRRRLEKALESEDIPDLLVIDGGRGQLSKALEARDELGIAVEIVAMAKMRTEKGKAVYGSEASKPERVFLPGSVEPIVLQRGEEHTLFLQRVRDEAHNYVIDFHRKVRGRRVHKSVLDDIPGVGPERRKRLFQEFGSLQVMREASVEEIARAGRMPKSLAEKVLSCLGEPDEAMS